MKADLKNTVKASTDTAGDASVQTQSQSVFLPDNVPVQTLYRFVSNLNFLYHLNPTNALDAGMGFRTFRFPSSFFILLKITATQTVFSKTTALF